MTPGLTEPGLSRDFVSKISTVIPFCCGHDACNEVGIGTGVDFEFVARNGCCTEHTPLAPAVFINETGHCLCR